MLSLARLHTLARVYLLRIAGKKVNLGKNSIISRKADLVLKKSLTIGDNCYIGSYTCLDTSSGEINIGDQTTIGRFCMIHGGTNLKDRIRLASHICVVPNDHLYKDKKIYIKNQGVVQKDIYIDSDVWIGAQATILAGSYIKEGCVIGASSLVKGNLDPYGVYVGIPAKKISQRQ